MTNPTSAPPEDAERLASVMQLGTPERARQDAELDAEEARIRAAADQVNDQIHCPEWFTEVLWLLNRLTIAKEDFNDAREERDAEISRISNERDDAVDLLLVRDDDLNQAKADLAKGGAKYKADHKQLCDVMYCERDALRATIAEQVRRLGAARLALSDIAERRVEGVAATALAASVMQHLNDPRPTPATSGETQPWRCQSCHKLVQNCECPGGSPAGYIDPDEIPSGLPGAAHPPTAIAGGAVGSEPRIIRAFSTPAPQPPADLVEAVQAIARFGVSPEAQRLTVSALAADRADAHAQGVREGIEKAAGFVREYLPAHFELGWVGEELSGALSKLALAALGES